MSDYTLQYPKFIAEEIGLSTNEINALKKKGCPFLGRKTSVAIVRAFLHQTMGAESVLGLPAHHQHSNGSKSDEPTATSGSPTSLHPSR